MVEYSTTVGKTFCELAAIGHGGMAWAVHCKRGLLFLVVVLIDL